MGPQRHLLWTFCSQRGARTHLSIRPMGYKMINYQVGKKCRSIFIWLAYNVGAGLTRAIHKFFFDKRSNQVRTIFEQVVWNSTLEEI
jgi:hypothetical protein